MQINMHIFSEERLEFFFICIFLIVSRNTIIFYIIPKLNMFNKNPKHVVCDVETG